MTLDFVITGDGIARFEDAVVLLGSRKRAYKAYGRALKHTGAKGFTQVKRALAPQVGLTQKRTVELGNLSFVRADLKSQNGRTLEVKVKASGNAISLKEFGARQFGYGVRAKAWGVSRRYPSAFIFAGTPGSGNPVMGGHVFKRTTSNSTPIERLWGPAIPKEMVKGASADAWQARAQDLGPRLRHEINVMTRGIVS